jgi:N-acetylneuraminate synthase
MIFKIGKKKISKRHKVYFIADIAANHDGDLKRAKKLIKLAAQSGADAVKFQHFKAETIVSDYGFNMRGKEDHQAKWKKSVFEIYKNASLNIKWTKSLFKESKKNKIDFMTAPYDLNYVDDVYKYICAYKIGSGDLNWREILVKISKKNKPVILATGASNMDEVLRSVKLIQKYNKKIVLMQCNTNYTYEDKNYDFINLNVIKSYKKKFKDNVILGLSDHTKGHTTVLGSVALGARVIEKHFTDNNNRKGPDHYFSMNPKTWSEMIKQTRILERSLGDGIKKVEKNELLTNFIQRRGSYAKKEIKKNTLINKDDIIFLRPNFCGSISPFLGKKTFGKSNQKILKGEFVFSR